MHVGETAIAVRVPDEIASLVDTLLVRLVVAVVWIEEIFVLADVVLQVHQTHFEIVKLPAVSMLGRVVDVVGVVPEVGGGGHWGGVFVLIVVSAVAIAKQRGTAAL